ALLQPVAADQLEDQQHEEDRQRRGDDPRLRGEADVVGLGGEERRDPHRSASAWRGLNWPTRITTRPLKMKKAERSGVRKGGPPVRSSSRTGTSPTRRAPRTAR